MSEALILTARCLRLSRRQVDALLTSLLLPVLLMIVFAVSLCWVSVLMGMLARSSGAVVRTCGRATATQRVATASRNTVAGTSRRHCRPPATDASRSTFVYRTA